MKYLFALALCVVAVPALGANTCTIRQFVTVQNVGGQAVQVALEPNTSADIQVSTSGSSAASAALNDRTTFIGIVCDQKTHFVIGINPTATTGSFWVPALTMYFTGVTVETDLKVAFIEGS